MVGLLMATVIVYRSQSASFAAKRVAAAAQGLLAVQQDHIGDHGNRDVLVRWDCHEPFPPNNAIDLNPLKAVQAARNKITARAMLGGLSPDTWTDIGAVRLPCVIRPERHKEGRHFFVCDTIGKVRTAIRRLRQRGWYASALLQKAREFRVFVVQGRVVAVSERFPANATDVAWNLALGGRLVNVDRGDWPVDVLRASIQACERLGLGFAAIDACITTDNRVYVFEANTSPALRNKYTIKQIARALAAAATEVKPIKEGARKPRSYVHPALLEVAPSRPIPAAPVPQVPAAAPIVQPVQPIVQQAPQAPGAAMPLTTPSAITATDQIALRPGETRQSFLARAEALFDSAVERERNERRRQAQAQLASLQAQITELQQRIASGDF